MKHLPLPFFAALCTLGPSLWAETPQDFFPPIERVGQQVNIPTPEEALRAMRQNGINADLKVAQFIVQNINKLDAIKPTQGGGTFLPITTAQVGSAFSFLSAQQVNVLTYLLNKKYNIAGQLPPANLPSIDAATFLAAVILAQGGYRLFDPQALLQAEVAAASSPSLPTSPARQNLNQVSNNTMNLMRMSRTKTSGDFFKDPFVGFDYSYTSYEDTLANNAGHSHNESISFGGTLGESTDLMVSMFHDELSQRGPNDLFSRSLGGSITALHHINDYIAVGALGFYSETDIEKLNGNAYSWGAGAILSTHLPLGEIAELDTVHTFTCVKTDYVQDRLYIGTARLSRQWTDWLNTGLSCSYTHAFNRDLGGDRDYIILGADAFFTITEALSLGLGYESTQLLENYRQDTCVLSVECRF